MSFRSRTALLVVGSALALMPAIVAGSAHAEGHLDASYTISFARIPVGEITATAVFGQNEYAISARARAGGVLKALLVDGEASFSTQGTIKDDYPVPTTFTSKIISSAETSDVTMTLDEGGNVKELTATPRPGSDVVPVSKANRQAIVDPLSALLFPAAAAGEGLSQETCRRTLPIFDGHHRYDLKLAFKRMDKMTVEKGYTGPVVVCSLSYEPIAGHRANIPLVKYLSEGREMEIALAPIAGTRLLAPFRLSVVSTLANLMIEANRFETIMAPAPAGAPSNIEHPSDTSPTRRDGDPEQCVRVGSGVTFCQTLRNNPKYCRSVAAAHQSSMRCARLRWPRLPRAGGGSDLSACCLNLPSTGRAAPCALGRCIDAKGDIPRHWNRASVPPEPSYLTASSSSP